MFVLGFGVVFGEPSRARHIYGFAVALNASWKKPLLRGPVQVAKATAFARQHLQLFELQGDAGIAEAQPGVSS